MKLNIKNIVEGVIAGLITTVLIAFTSLILSPTISNPTTSNPTTSNPTTSTIKKGKKEVGGIQKFRNSENIFTKYEHAGINITNEIKNEINKYNGNKILGIILLAWAVFFFSVIISQFIEMSSTFNIFIKYTGKEIPNYAHSIFWTYIFLTIIELLFLQSIFHYHIMSFVLVIAVFSPIISYYPIYFTGKFWYDKEGVSLKNYPHQVSTIQKIIVFSISSLLSFYIYTNAISYITEN